LNAELTSFSDGWSRLPAVRPAGKLCRVFSWYLF